MATITHEDADEIKSGIVNIHRLLELKKLHVKCLSAGKRCASCNSFCKELGLQKQTRRFIQKYFM